MSDSALSAKPVPFCWSVSDDPLCTKKPLTALNALCNSSSRSKAAAPEADALFAELASTVLEEHCVEQVGRFVLFASGRVRCVFADRNIVETRLGVRRLRPILAQRNRALEHTGNAALHVSSVLLAERGPRNAVASRQQLSKCLSDAELDVREDASTIIGI